MKAISYCTGRKRYAEGRKKIQNYFQGTAKEAVCRSFEQIARLTSVPYIVRSSAENGFYSWAGQKGVPAVIIERGGCGLVKRHEIEADIVDVRNILRGLGFLRDGIQTVTSSQHLIRNAYYENAPCHGCWHPQKLPGDMVVKNELLGEIRDIYGELSERIFAKTTGVILYQTVSLGIEEGTPMVAYGELND
ncbi:succinylglutamate desuccinylase/aspartoacylase family protein [Ventrimonas sp. CLA-AP-H27]|uniref:Succinylglutamate desuccinylase/aspartoacylase family protein n=1 Tax=Ventrimonas faecis TaxID=3133170 RepID=A0ABV1HNL8_9FIRM